MSSGGNLSTIEVTSYSIAGGCFLILLSLTSIVCGVLTLRIIHATNGRFSGYITLIYHMTACQIIYETTFIIICFASLQRQINYVSNFTSSFGGLSNALWTNVISTFICYTVFTFKFIDILKYMRVLSVLMYSLCFVLAIVSDVYLKTNELMDQIYYSIRVSSILYNFIVVSMLSIRLQHMSMSSNSFWRPAIGGSAAAPLVETSVKDSDVALRWLVERVKYYPIVQVVSRMGALIYEAVFWKEYTANVVPSESSSVLFKALFLVFTILTPSTGILYFFIFLKTQPNIYEFFKANWHDLLLCHNKNRMDTSMFHGKEAQRQNSVASARDEFEQLSNPPNPSIVSSGVLGDLPSRLTVPAPKRYNLLSDEELQDEIRRSYDDRLSIGSINENPLYL